MAVEDQAVSGQATDNAGPPEAPSKESALDRALSAALTDIEGDVPLEVAHKAKTEREQKSKSKPSAGDKSDGENAAAPGNKAEAKAGEAAPTGDASPREAPKHWPESERKAFAELDRKSQDILLKRDKDLQGIQTRQSQELGDDAKYAKAIKSLVDDQTRQVIAQSGMDEVGYFRYLNQLNKWAMGNGEDYIDWAVRNLRIDPRRLAQRWGLSVATGQPAPQQQQQPQQGTGDPRLDELLSDPAVKQLSTDLGQTKQQLQQLYQYMAQREQAQQRAQQEYTQRQQQQVQQGLQNVINTFRTAQDDHGQLKYPHFDVVSTQMGALMDTHSDLKAMAEGEDKMAKAYERALRAHPELFNSVLEAETAKKMAEKDKAAEAARAKKAIGPKPASGAPTAPARKKGLDGAFGAALTQLGLDR